ncbi:MAG: hypothetical protein WCI05_13960 [Myxococcales bacterium]
MTRILIGTLLLLAACRAKGAPRTPEETCASACTARVARCGAEECARGCNFILDRLVEREMDTVLACVAKTSACDDPAWAKCAVLVGVHLDGGPPPPPPPDES